MVSSNRRDPFSVWADWYNQLAPEIARELAYALAKLWPNQQLRELVISAHNNNVTASAFCGTMRATSVSNYRSEMHETSQIYPNLNKVFIDKLRGLHRSRIETIGLVTVLCALTDLIFLERTDPETWSDSDALLELLDGNSPLAPSLNPFQEQLTIFAQRIKARAPLRQRLWAKAAESWYPIRSLELAPMELSEALQQLRHTPEAWS